MTIGLPFPSVLVGIWLLRRSGRANKKEFNREFRLILPLSAGGRRQSEVGRATGGS